MSVAGKPVRDTERMDTPDEDLDKTILETPAVASAAAHAWLEQRRGKPDEPKTKPASARPQIKAKAKPKPKPKATPKPPPAAAKSSKKGKKAAPARDPDDVRTMLDMSALPSSPPPKKGSRRSAPVPAPTAKKKKKLDKAKLDQIAASTRVEVAGGAAGATRFDAEALPADAIAQATARAKAPKGKRPPPSKKPAPAKKSASGKKPAGGKRQQSPEFSETQWFMKGIEVDADLLEMVEEEEYLRDESISEEKRKKFTLREDGEE